MSHLDASDVREGNGAIAIVVTTGVTLALALATAQLATCDERRFLDDAPAVAEGSGMYTVAWVRERRRGGSVEVQQFDKYTLKPNGGAKTVLRQDDLVAGAVELVALKDEAAYLAIGRVADLHHPGLTKMLTVPLDEHGQRAGEPTDFWMVDSTCPGAADAGPYVMLAFRRSARSHHYPNDDLGVLILEHNGSFRTWWELAYNPAACSSAVRDGEIVLAWASPVSDRSSYKLRVAFEDPRPGGRHKRLVVPVGNVGGSHARIVPLGADWAILYEDTADHLHVAVINAKGELLRVTDLPDTIDNESADLGVNDRGLFLSWNDGGHVRFGDVAGRSRVMKAAGNGASATRALGDRRRCLAVWTMDRKRARMVESESCP